MFTAALFTIPRSCKHPKCPSSDGRINKIQYAHTMESYSAINRKKVGLLVAQSVKHLTLDFSLGHDPRDAGSSPESGSVLPP